MEGYLPVRKNDDFDISIKPLNRAIIRTSPPSATYLLSQLFEKKSYGADDMVLDVCVDRKEGEESIAEDCGIIFHDLFDLNEDYVPPIHGLDRYADLPDDIIDQCLSHLQRIYSDTTEPYTAIGARLYRGAQVSSLLQACVPRSKSNRQPTVKHITKEYNDFVAKMADRAEAYLAAAKKGEELDAKGEPPAPAAIQFENMLAELEGTRYMVLPCGADDHWWCTIYDAGAKTFYVYDSLPTSRKFSRKWTPMLKAIFDLLHEDKGETADITYCNTERQGVNQCGYYTIHNVHRFLQLLRDERGKPVEERIDAIASDISRYSTLPKLNDKIVNSWRKKLIEFNEYDNLRMRRNDALATASSILRDGIPPWAEKEVDRPFWKYKNYDTPQKRRELLVESLGESSAVPTDTQGGYMYCGRVEHAVAYTDTCGWASVVQDWDDDNVAGLIFQVPSRDGTQYLYKAVGWGQKVLLTTRRGDYSKPLFLKKDETNMTITERNELIQSERTKLEDYLAQEPKPMADKATLEWHKSFFPRMMSTESPKVLLSADNEGAWARLGYMPQNFWLSAPVTINGVALNNCHLGTVLLPDIAVIRIGICKYVWLQKFPPGKDQPVQKPAEYEHEKLLDWLDIGCIREEHRAFQFITSEKSTELEDEGDGDGNNEDSDKDTTSYSRDESEYMLFQLLKRMVGSVNEQMELLQEDPNQGHLHHHHRPRQIISDHLDRVDYYTKRHPEKFPWQGSSTRKTAQSLLEECRRLKTKASDDKDSTAPIWEKFEAILSVGQLACDIWYTVPGTKEQETMECLSAACDPYRRKVNHKSRRNTEEVEAKEALMRWYYGADGCKKSCPARKNDCKIDCDKVHLHPLAIDQTYKKTYMKTHLYPGPSFYSDKTWYNKYLKTGKSGLREDLLKYKWMKTSAKFTKTEFPPFSWKPKVVADAEFWKITDQPDVKNQVKMCIDRLTEYTSLPLATRDALWRSKDLYFVGIDEIFTTSNWAALQKAARNRALYDIDKLGKSLCPRAENPVMTVYLHIYGKLKRKADTTSDELEKERAAKVPRV